MIEMDKKYQTRDGRAVRILCVDGPDPDYPIIGTIKGQSVVITWTPSGRFNNAEDYPCDLIPIPTKHEGWAVVDPYSTLDEMPIQMCRSYQALVGEMKREGLTVPRFRIAHVTWED